VEDSIFKVYKRTPSLGRELGVLVFWVLVLSTMTYLGATKGLEKPFDIGFFSARMAPIYSLFGTVCLAYEFFTAMRNESNKNRLSQLTIKAMEMREAALAIVAESDRNKRMDYLGRKIEAYNEDLEYEIKYSRRKYIIAWFGICLVIIATFLQLP
jgi:hypothetical protein